jgi:phosphopantothenoylcysteine synthetase/decarboxylase
MKDKIETIMPMTSAAIRSHASSSGKKLMAVATKGAADPIRYFSKRVVGTGRSGIFTGLPLLHRWRKFG